MAVPDFLTDTEMGYWVSATVPGKDTALLILIPTITGPVADLVQ